MNSAHQARGDKFWSVLKQEFGNQVDAFIKVDCTGWSNYCAAAKKEIGKSAYPSFLLYKKGKVVNNDTPKDIRIWGGAEGKNLKPILAYIRNNSYLN